MELSSIAPQTGNSAAQFHPSDEYKGVYLLDTSHRNYNNNSFATVDLTGNNLIGTPFSRRIFKMVKKDFPFVLAVIREKSRDKEGIKKEGGFLFDAKELHEWKNSGRSSFTNPITNNRVKIVEYYAYFKEEPSLAGRTFSYLATIDYTKPIKGKVDSIEHYLKANRGDPEALVLLGTNYKVSIGGLERNSKLAMACYQRAVKKDFPAAFGLAAQSYLIGDGVKIDHNMALALSQRGAELGDVNSLHQLGYSYFRGKGIPKDEKKAFECFLEASKKGQMDATYFLALCYRDGKGVEKDGKKAFECFALAATLGVEEAAFQQAECFRLGIGVVKNDQTAFKMYMQGVEKGHTESLYMAGFFLQYGVGVAAPDLQKALEYYQKAADKGHVGALNNLGDIYINIDKKKAVTFFMRTAANKDPKGLSKLAFCFQNGIGVEKDLKQAFKYYSGAAMGGFKKAWNELASFYQYGIEMEKNLWKALDCHVLAGNSQAALACLHELAAAGDPEAQNQLGNIYRDGKGVKKDPEKAFSFYKMAADQDCPNGLFHLGICYYLGIGTEKNPKNAVDFLQKGADKGNIHALNNLGICLLRGTGVPKDLQKAKECLQSALDKGHTPAQKALDRCVREEKKALEPDQNVEAGNPYILKRKRGGIDTDKKSKGEPPAKKLLL